MTSLSNSANLRFSLDSVISDAPKEWADVSFNANSEEGDNVPTIDIEALTFVNKEADFIREWISSGRMFQGIPFKIDAYNVNLSQSAFDGFINCSDGIEVFEDRTVKAKIQLANGLDNINDRLNGITMSYLESINVFTDSDYKDVKYVVEKSDTALEIVINITLGYVLSVQLQQQIKSTAESIATVSGIAVSGFTGGIGAAILATAAAIINVVFTVFMVIAIIDLGTKTFELLLPIPRTHKVLNLRTALSKITSYLGLNFSSPIALLDKLNYLPSNLNSDEINLLTGVVNFPKGTQTGLPNERDFGFTAGEMFDLCQRMFNAEIKVVGNTLNFRSKNDPFWSQSASYQMPSNILPVKRYNSDELVFSRLLKFDTDEIADEWTINNFKGTNYEIITSDPTIPVGSSNYLKNHETINFPVALGNRKNELNALENSLSVLAGIIDDTVNFFGGSSNIAGSIDSRIGILKVGTNNTTKAKILYLNGSKMPSNHRDLFSAKVLYNLYINEKSFVLNNFGGQKAIYPVENLPFGLEDFIETISNSNFKDSNNVDSRFRSINWLIASDFANAEFEQHEIYAKNLIETYIEAA